MGIERLHRDKEEVKASLFADDMTAYIRDPEEFIRKLSLEVITTFRKIARYSINTQSQQPFYVRMTY